MELNIPQFIFTDSTVCNEITQQLKCCICMEIFHEPTSLPCGHTFCYKCLVDIAQHKRRSVKNSYVVLDMTIPCPSCRLAVPYTSIMTQTHGVASNFILKSIIELFCTRGQIRCQKDASTNTDTVAYSAEKMKRIASMIDFTAASLQLKGSIIYDCRDEIDIIRKNQENSLKSEEEMIYGENDHPMDIPQSFETSNIDPGDLDPAILSVTQFIPQHPQEPISDDALSDLFTRYGH